MGNTNALLIAGPTQGANGRERHALPPLLAGNTMAQYRIEHHNHNVDAEPLVVRCVGDDLAHQIADALRANGWWVGVCKEAEYLPQDV